MQLSLWWWRRPSGCGSGTPPGSKTSKTCFNRAGNRGTPLRRQELVALANSGDRWAREAIREPAEFLAPGIGNLLAGLNPKYVMVDGELTKTWDILDSVMKKSLLRGVFGLEFKNVRIIPPPHREKPSRGGAISLALSGHFAPPALH